MEILVEEHKVTKMRIDLKLRILTEYGPPSVLVEKKDPRQPS
jgi:hypothetical protein